MSVHFRQRFVTISCFHGEMDGFHATGEDALVAVDVIRATTTAVTAVALGRQCFPASSLESATLLETKLSKPLLVGELGGHMPHGFEITNSPAAVARRDDIERPMILLSTSGTKLVCAGKGDVYLGCLRNYNALVAYLASHHANVLIGGAGTRGEFREEDALCCAWLGAGLLNAGYEVRDAQTRDVIDQWAGRPVNAFVGGKSTEYLLETGQLDDLEFILDHIDDLDWVAYRAADEVIRMSDAQDVELDSSRSAYERR